MVLADVDLKARLGDLAIETPNPNFPFHKDLQIQPCSIDLRLSEVFWVPRRGRIDLSDDTPLGPQVTRAFVRRKMVYPKGFKLRPGKFLLGRTYEKFSIPNGLMGRLVGRSSFGRLGLSVATQSNLINPGWSGHMPLIIFNQSPFDVILHPYIGVVQLCLLHLTNEAGKPYGSVGVGSKYVGDDGGPSKYWLDRTIADLRSNRNGRTAHDNVVRVLERFSQALDEPTRRRFGHAVEKAGTITEVDDLLGAFVASERIRAAIFPVGTMVISVLAGILVSWLPAMWSQGMLARTAAGLVAAAFALGLGWIAWTQWGSTIAPGELRRIATEVN